MKNTKLILIIGVIIIVLMIGVLMEQKSSRNEKVNVGVILPLTGSLAKTGSDAKIALEIAQEDLRKSNINLIIEDDMFTPKDSVTVFNKIVNMADVVAVIGPLNGSSIESVRSIAIKNKVPLFTPYGGGNDMGEYVYKNSVEGSDEARIMADKADSLGYKKLSIIYLQNDFGLKYLNSFRTSVINNGGELVAEEPAPFGMSDFRTALTKIKGAKPDAIYIVNNSVSIGEIARQAGELGLNIPLLSQYATESSDLIRVGGKSLENMLYTFPIDESRLTKAQRDFISKFEKKTGDKPQIIAYNIYDIYFILVAATEKCGADKECINNYLGNIKEFDGVGGKFSIVQGKLVRDFYFKTVKDGKFVSDK